MKTPDILKKTGGKAAEVVRQFTVRPDDDGVRLDRWFKRHLPDVGFATVSRWARTGQIRVDGKRAEVDTRLVAGQALRVPPGGALPPGPAGDKARKPLTEEEIAAADAMVMTQDRAAIILNKPPGLATQGGSGTFSHVDGLLDAYVTGSGPRPRLVHRLDKDTSGVLLVARTPGSAAFFSKQFAGRSTRKIYWALVVGIPEVYDGMIELPLSKQPGTGGEKMMVDESGEGQTARTRYRVIDRAGNSTAWVELQPLTGAHAPVARAYGRDRASDRGRRQIRRPGRIPDRIDQPQDAPARAAPDHSASRRRYAGCDSAPARPFRRQPDATGLYRKRRRPAAGGRSQSRSQSGRKARRPRAFARCTPRSQRRTPWSRCR